VASVIISGSAIYNFMSKNKKIFLFIITSVLVASGVYFSKAKKPEVTYSTAMVEKGTIKKTVSVTGKVVAQKEINLSSKLNGQVELLWVDVGESVAEGQKIAVIDSGTLPNQLEQARHELDAQKRQLSNMERRKDTYNYFQKQAQREVIKKVRSMIAEIEKKIADATIYSPVSGIVIRKSVETGEIVSGGPIVTVATEGELEVRVEVPESDIVDVKVGQRAKISLDAFQNGETFSATVFDIEPASTVIQDVVYYKVKLRFDSFDERFKVGMSADVDISTDEKNNTIIIPARALKTEDEKNYVEILKDENAVEKIFVKTGMTGDEGTVEIVSGLSGGENVVILTTGK
jgi:RND family efflux transporter MFP subunit